MESGEAVRMARSSRRDREELSANQEVQDVQKDSCLNSASVIRDPETETLLVDLTGQEYMQLLKVPLDPSHGLHGVLRYRRESQKKPISLQPSPPTDQSVSCEFCGTTAKPPLDPIHREPKDFCCLRYKAVYEEVAQERKLVLGLCEGIPRGTTRPKHTNSRAEEELEMGAGEKESEEHRMHQKEIERFYKEAQERLSSENNFFHTKTLTFQLSGCAPGDEKLAVKKDSTNEGTPNPWPNPSGPGPSGFGLNHHQASAGFRQKFYSNGNKFLTGFPDGSTQVFYPSGNLAIVLFTSDKERLCVVHDDLAPHCPIRALFQSGGGVTCYHGNGRVWLNLCTWGGQSLDEDGARTKRWSWSDHTQTPIPFRPIFLSLNKYVGVRILGRHSVFLTFLASGQQARFDVGSFGKPNDGSPLPRGPSLSREELVLLACRLYLRLTLARLQCCLRFPSSPKHRSIKPAPIVLSLARRLLSLSHSFPMSDMDRTFIQHCLQGCQ